jgi:hypothetical protein
MTKAVKIDVIFPHKGSLSSLTSTLVKWEAFFAPCKESLSQILLVTDSETIDLKDKISCCLSSSFFRRIVFIEDIKLSGVYPAWNQALPYIIGQYVFITGSNDGPICNASVLDVSDDLKRFSRVSNLFCVVYDELRFLPGSDKSLPKQYFRKAESNVPKMLYYPLFFINSLHFIDLRWVCRIFMSIATLRGLPIHMQSTIFPSSLLKEYLFDESLSIASDYAFWCSIVGNVDSYFSNRATFSFDLSGISVCRRDDMINETFAISKRHFSVFSAITFLWLKKSSLINKFF